MTMMFPSAHDRSFVPYPLGADLKFEACMPPMLLEEGGYSDAAHDSGGQTMEGMTGREYDLKRRQWGLPTRWVHLISASELRTIYYTDYWMPNCPGLPAGLDLMLFDQCVNEGPTTAVRILQRALGIADDGMFGSATRMSVKAVIAQGRTKSMIDIFMLAREHYYRSLPADRYFDKDWMARSARIDTKAKAMVA